MSRNAKNFTLEDARKLFLIMLRRVIKRGNYSSFIISSDLLEGIEQEYVNAGCEKRTAPSLKKRFKKDWKDITQWRVSRSSVEGVTRDAPRLINEEIQRELDQYDEMCRHSEQQAGAPTKPHRIAHSVATARVAATPPTTLPSTIPKPPMSSSSIDMLLSEVKMMHQLMREMLARMPPQTSPQAPAPPPPLVQAVVGQQVPTAPSIDERIDEHME
eukprot:gnl/Dysnectes_brevis/1572_a1782_2573.p1 GENE.gnl/Dysnectes_brevis/1572_a1782_2573~~gnl/Dysnectes_brevis/1572_a1782_2573.p1  ORF type:complete len:215 (-),score=42.83 gnl/Dysnectes_brevis/1572_a1782_2573:55-699(-)